MPARPLAGTAVGQSTSAQLANRILGGWLGRIAGCNLGKPIENGDFWSPSQIREYLEMVDAYPLRDYIRHWIPCRAVFSSTEAGLKPLAAGYAARLVTTTSTIRSWGYGC
jgi:hypothetical protein